MINRIISYILSVVLLAPTMLILQFLKDKLLAWFSDYPSKRYATLEDLIMGAVLFTAAEGVVVLCSLRMVRPRGLLITSIVSGFIGYIALNIFASFFGHLLLIHGLHFLIIGALFPVIYNYVLHKLNPKKIDGQ